MCNAKSHRLSRDELIQFANQLHLNLTVAVPSFQPAPLRLFLYCAFITLAGTFYPIQPGSLGKATRTCMTTLNTRGGSD